MAANPRQVPVEYRVDRASNNMDVQREQLNRILEDIKKKLASAGANVDYVTRQQLEAALANLPIGGGGGINSVVAGFAISVDNTDPDNPIVNVVPTDLISADADNALVLGGDGGLFVPGGGGGGGVLPVVTGEVPPVLVYFDDGSLMYAPVGD